MLDDDLQFAAQMHVADKRSLPAWRKRALGLLKELKRRLEPVTAHLRTFQTAAIAGVTAKRDLGLTAMLVILTQWGDTGYPYGLITGLPPVGTAPWSGVSPAQPCVQITLEDVLAETHQHNLDVITRLKPGVMMSFCLYKA